MFKTKRERGKNKPKVDNGGSKWNKSEHSVIKSANYIYLHVITWVVFIPVVHSSPWFDREMTAQHVLMLPPAVQKFIAMSNYAVHVEKQWEMYINKCFIASARGYTCIRT